MVLQSIRRCFFPDDVPACAAALAEAAKGLPIPELEGVLQHKRLILGKKSAVDSRPIVHRLLLEAARHAEVMLSEKDVARVIREDAAAMGDVEPLTNDVDGRVMPAMDEAEQGAAIIGRSQVRPLRPLHSKPSQIE